ncbi:S8 family serine peptidase [Virgibacillus sp. 179-BFC.A HS]|uniref:S8 family serine peptidase n=1 Tax=Tigheibacillus jepli TaxID=3035914 RepID=A0ABU5CG88_9BACI|nr:S8 family serine peptidase [Virgibacillus sp. 179-BFC.A HS]MDY0404560.1 S8 family serine peptidase [Virgibacillus sp. 179-BFC.A HS]
MYQVNFFSDKHVSFLRDALHIFCKLLLMLTCLLVVVPAPSFAAAKTDAAPSRFTPPQDDRASVIIEVEGDAKQHREYLRNYFPNTEIIAVYDTLFNGLAIKTKPEKLAKIASLEFVKAIHPVATYQANFSATAGMTKTKKLKDMLKTDKNAVLPQTLNTTSYTGKGIKVGIIDTGIDYNHPDLRNNYQGGYDLVDLDDDPMETTPEQGAPTLHGTHVAGIIAADGDLKGVAPDASIYSYRALGPGGSGTSAQVIAALEQAVKDGMDVVNLSLGNTVNGPDYPTSIAVNKAYELGVFVVIANGNDGPGDWTVGSPATAVKSFSVGALANEQQIPVLAARHENLQIHMTPMLGSVPWELQRDYAITTDLSQTRGKIALLKRGKSHFTS